MGAIAAIMGSIGGLCAVMGILTAMEVISGISLTDIGWMFWFMLAAILLLGTIAFSLGGGGGKGYD
jgi:hypothetical protein